MKIGIVGCSLNSDYYIRFAKDCPGIEMRDAFEKAIKIENGKATSSLTYLEMKLLTALAKEKLALKIHSKPKENESFP